MKDQWSVHPDYANGVVYSYKRRRRKRRIKHHIGITIAVGAVALAHLVLPHSLEGWSPLFGFIANLIWIWSD